MVGSHWPTLAASSHLIEPPNGLKQLKMRSQWGFSQAFPLMMIKVILPFIQTKANLKITTCLTPWGPKPLLLTKNQSLIAPQTLYKTLSSAHKGTSHVLPTNLNFGAKAYLANQQSHNSEAWGWKYGYRGTFPLFLTTSLNFLFWVTVGQSFRPVMFFYTFSTFLLLAFWFSLVKAPLAFVLYIVNFGLNSPQINTSKEPKGRFRPFSYFRPLS